MGFNASLGVSCASRCCQVGEFDSNHCRAQAIRTLHRVGSGYLVRELSIERVARARAGMRSRFRKQNIKRITHTITTAASAASAATAKTNRAPNAMREPRMAVGWWTSLMAFGASTVSRMPVRLLPWLSGPVNAHNGQSGPSWIHPARRDSWGPHGFIQRVGTVGGSPEAHQMGDTCWHHDGSRMAGTMMVPGSP